ncbi:Sugar ABC transporter substrate-binding protein [Ruminococcaceae bacterium BL-6]|nr:Sugar ABC transporter substrate-binding protein [Ruminococcaceae bacterium BL-6]
MKKLLACALALAMAAASFSGCAGKKGAESGAGSAAGSGAAGEPVTITHWYWADNSDYSATMQQIAKDFNAANGKNITVKAEEYPWDGGAYSENLFNAVMGGGAPDTAAWKLTATPLFTANNLLAKLDDYVTSWKDKDEIDDNIYKIMREAGGKSEMYVMPWNIQVLYVYYRPSIFKKAGVEVPKTYEEFLGAVKKCTLDTNGDGKTDVYGFGMRGAKGGQEPWGSFLYGRGGSFEKLDSPESVQGMQDFIDLYKNHYVPPTAPQDGFNEIIANFKSGKTAMTIHHTGSSADMVKTFGDDVDAFPFPKGKGQWTSMGDTENVIFEASEHKDAAFEWVSYLATGAGQEKWCKVTGNVPVSKKVQEMSEFKDNKFMKASIAGQSYAGILPIRDTTTEWISTIWPNTVASALAGKTSADDAMKTLQKALYEK